MTRKPRYCVDASVRIGGVYHSANENVATHWHANFRHAWREAREAKKSIGPDAWVRIIEYDPADCLHDRYSVPPYQGLREWDA